MTFASLFIREKNAEKARFIVSHTHTHTHVSIKWSAQLGGRGSNPGPRGRLDGVYVSFFCLSSHSLGRCLKTGNEHVI